MKTIVAVAILAVIVVLGALFSLPEATRLQVAAVAPVVTATLAVIAAIIALTSVHVQRDTARRRAAVDFFLKTEMDESIIKSYNDFLNTIPTIPTIIARRPLRRTDPDVLRLKKWLNVCELIAVAVNLEAFSNTVAKDYWGYVIPDSFNDSKPFIDHIRTTGGNAFLEKLGDTATYCELEKLAKKWQPPA